MNPGAPAGPWRMTPRAVALDPVLSPASLAPGRRAVLVGRVLGAVVSLFIAFDAALKLASSPMAIEGTAALGYPVGVVFPLGVIELLSLVLYLVPRTAPLGALVWTGYLGGAVATHVRMDHPLATHTLMPIYIAVLLWGSLWLRDRRVRGVLA